MRTRFAGSVVGGPPPVSSCPPGVCGRGSHEGEASSPGESVFLQSVNKLANGLIYLQYLQACKYYIACTILGYNPHWLFAFSNNEYVYQHNYTLYKVRSLRCAKGEQKEGKRKTDFRQRWNSGSMTGIQTTEPY